MIVYLHELRAARDQAITLQFEEKFPLESDVGQLTQPVVGDVHLQLNQNYLLVDGDLEGSPELVCDRCLGRFELPVSMHIDEAIPLATAGDVAVDKWTLAMVEVIGKQETVDVTELVRQYTLLAIPPRRICSPACAPHRTGDRAQTIDPRLSKLSQLLPKQP